MQNIQRTVETALRAKSLGTLGELLALKALVDNRFDRIRNVNDVRMNCPFGDLVAERDGVRYLISVKARNKYQRSGTLNGSYKLGNGIWRNHATRECLSLKAQPAWLAVQFNGERYSIYFGTVEQLGMRNGIPMQPAHVQSYETLVNNRKHGLDFRPYINRYAED